MFSYLYGKVRLKRRSPKEDEKADSDRPEVQHHDDQPSPPDNREVHPEPDDHHSNGGWSEPRQQQSTGQARGRDNRDNRGNRRGRGYGDQH